MQIMQWLYYNNYCIEIEQWIYCANGTIMMSVSVVTEHAKHYDINGNYYSIW